MTSAPTLRPAKLLGPFLMMLSFGDGFRSWRVGLAAVAGLGISFSRRPLATASARPASMFSRCETIRARIAGVSTLLSSNVRALAMCVCSISVWLM